MKLFFINLFYVLFPKKVIKKETKIHTNIINNKFSEQNRLKNIIKSKLKEGDYSKNFFNHYLFIIDGEKHIYGILAIINIFGYEVEINESKKTFAEGFHYGK